VPLLDIDSLETTFFTHIGGIQAVRGVSLSVNDGEVLGVVGESGCGKSVTMLSVMGLLPEGGRIVGGKITFNGADITNLRDGKMSAVRGREIGMIFQDPMTSLNPVLTVGRQLTEHLIKHEKVSRKAANARALDMLKLVGIPDPAARLKQYPHEFSGGMRQRVMIAISLICRPRLIIADEPTTALDVTIQAQILDLLKELQKTSGAAVILITHDLGVVADICERVVVMYGGMVAEEARARDLFKRGRHPYTWGLMRSVPNPKEGRAPLEPIEGSPPDLFNPPPGCPFAARCEKCMRICLRERPPLYEISSTHKAACFLNHPDYVIGGDGRE
jgi:oligopeptide transport system ATP-binding protein